MSAAPTGPKVTVKKLLELLGCHILQARNATPELADLISIYISLGNSTIFAPGPFMQPTVISSAHRSGLLLWFLFFSVCPGWLMLLLYKLQRSWKHSTWGQLSSFKYNFVYDLYRMSLNQKRDPSDKYEPKICCYKLAVGFLPASLSSQAALFAHWDS